MPNAKGLRDEVEGNFKAISSQMDWLIHVHAHKYALMRGGEVIEFYFSWEDAYRTGRRFFEDGRFSVQEVTRTPVDLGWYSRFPSPAPS